MLPIMRSLFFLLAWALAVVSCGLPDPLDTAVLVNPPFRVETRSSNETIFVTVYSFNTPQIAQQFIGYNVYFGEQENYLEIDDNLLFYSYVDRSPTILARPRGGIQSVTISFNEITYTNFVETNYTQEEQLETQDRYYFIVKSVVEDTSDRLGGRNDFFHIAKEAIEVNRFYVTNTYEASDSVRIDEETYHLSLSRTHIESATTDGEDGEDLPEEERTSIQDLGWRESWFDVREAPLEGYGFLPLPLVKGHLYVFRTPDNRYGKIYILEKTDSEVVYHFAFQPLENETQI